MALSINELELGCLYAVNMVFPPALDQPSPASSPQLQPHIVNAPHARNKKSRKPRLAVVMGKEENAVIIFVGTRNPTPFPHRFVSMGNNPPYPFQPQPNVTPEPLNTFDKFGGGGFVNFSHSVRVLPVQEFTCHTNLSFSSIYGPGEVRVKEPGGNSKIMASENVFLKLQLPPDQLRYLRSLHDNYWAGIRYDNQGVRIGTQSAVKSSGADKNEEEPDPGAGGSTNQKGIGGGGGAGGGARGEAWGGTGGGAWGGAGGKAGGGAGDEVGGGACGEARGESGGEAWGGAGDGVGGAGSEAGGGLFAEYVVEGAGGRKTLLPPEPGSHFAEVWPSVIAEILYDQFENWTDDEEEEDKPPTAMFLPIGYYFAEIDHLQVDGEDSGLDDISSTVMAY